MKARDDFEEKYVGKMIKSYTYCDAILLGFKENKVHDLSIPSSSNIYSLVDLSLRILSGEKINPKDVNCMTTEHWGNRLTLDKFNSVLKDKKIAKNLFDCFDYDDTRTSVIGDYLSLNSKFRSEWFYGHGTWFNFREGQREKSEKRVLENLTGSEQDRIKMIGDAFQPFVGLTDSPCKCL